MSWDALMTLHRGLPREGPGSDDCTREALRRLPAPPPNPVVLDLGCGPGRQTLVLARELNARVVAVDRHQPFLDQLRWAADAQGLSDLIEARRGDMGALDVGPGSVDLIWSEGAAYILGFAEALRLWGALLKPGGLLAVTECTWLTDDRPEEARAFWHAAYPAMGTVAENRRTAAAVGLEVLDSFPLPEAAWWDEYYHPLSDRAKELRPNATGELLGVLDEAGREIELFRRHGDSYGYVFYLLRVPARPVEALKSGRTAAPNPPEASHDEP